MLGIAELLATKKHSVPTYQRPYSWIDDQTTLRYQVVDFWNDLAKAKSSADEYFLGTVVESRQGASAPDRLSIVDGQQRLATTAILLAAIRDTYLAGGDKERAETIQGQYLAKKDLMTNTVVSQLQLNGEDDPFFYDYIITGTLKTPATRESHRAIKAAYEKLRGYIGEVKTDAGPKWAESLAEWAEFLAANARIIRVTVETEAEAFVIFETLNDRGADLTISDLLKILLFSKAGARIDTVRDSWVRTMGGLNVAAEGGQIFNDFLRTYWSSKHGPTRERELHARIRDTVSTEQDAVDLVLELETASSVYHALLNPSSLFWKGYPVDVRKNLGLLADLNLVQNRPMLLAAASRLPKNRFGELLRKLVSWSVRGLIVGGIGGGTAEGAYCGAATKIWDKALKTVADIKGDLGAILFSDREFESSFTTARISNGKIARYLLYALERANSSVAQPELVPNEDVSEVTLEHVLPQNPTAADWPQFSEEEVRAYRYRVGNQALLKGADNSKLGNTSFAVKAPVLKASQLALTKSVGSEAQWTAAEIEKRQAALAKLAVKAWKL